MVGVSLQLHTSCFFFADFQHKYTVTKKNTQLSHLYHFNSTECSSCKPQVYGGCVSAFKLQ